MTREAEAVFEAQVEREDLIDILSETNGPLIDAVMEAGEEKTSIFDN